MLVSTEKIREQPSYRRIDITPEHLDLGLEILRGGDDGLHVHEIVNQIEYDLNIYDLNRATMGNHIHSRKRIKKFLMNGPKSTAEIIEHLNTTTRHGTVSQIVVNIVSKDLDITGFGKTRRLGSRYGSYQIAVWTLKVFVKFEWMMEEDKRFEQTDDGRWKAVNRKMGKAQCEWCEEEVVGEEWLIKKRLRRNSSGYIFCSSRCMGLYNVKPKTLSILVLAHDGMEPGEIADDLDVDINNVWGAIKRHFGGMNALRKSDIDPVMRMIDKKS